jgi:hypothetical protein
MDQSSGQHGMSKSAQRYRSFSEFYPFYLSEHADVQCRRLHFIGSLGVLMVLTAVLCGASPWWLWSVPVLGYGFAWIGHFRFEHNRPATFTHPLYSLAGDWLMFWNILRGKISI